VRPLLFAPAVEQPTLQVNDRPPVVTKSPVHMESIDVGAALLLSSHSIVQSVCFRSYHPLSLLPDSGGFAIGDPRSGPPDQCAAKVAARACPTEHGGRAALDLAYAPLVKRRREVGFCGGGGWWRGLGAGRGRKLGREAKKRGTGGQG